MNIAGLRGAALAVVILAAPAAGPALAQDDYPNRAVQLVIPYPPGGSDALGRKIAGTMAANTGADIIVANVPGASTQVASRMVAQAAPDGYTIYVASPPEFVAGPAFYENLPFDPMTDFTLISYHAQVPYLLLVNTELPVKTYEEFLAYLEDNPGAVLFGSYGALSQSDVLARRFRKETGIDFEIIPYSGGSPAFNALLAGEIQAIFATPIPTRGHIADGKMLPLAVTTAERLKLFPDAPTLMERGLDIDDAASYGLAGPAGLPDEVVAYWNTEWTKAMNDPETKAFIEDMGVQIVGSSPEYFRTWLEDNTALWAELADSLELDKQ